MRHRGHLVVFFGRAKQKGSFSVLRGVRCKGAIPNKTKGGFLFILEGVTVMAQGRPKKGYLDFSQKRCYKGSV